MKNYKNFETEITTTQEDAYEAFQIAKKALETQGFEYRYNGNSGEHEFYTEDECLSFYDYPAEEGSDWIKIMNELVEKFPSLKAMDKTYQLVEINEGEEAILMEGSEDEILSYWEAEKSDLTAWLLDSLDEGEVSADIKKKEIANRNDGLAESCKCIEELEWILRTYFDYSYWCLKILEK